MPSESGGRGPYGSPCGPSCSRLAVSLRIKHVDHALLAGDLVDLDSAADR
ncbi:hypothetical protein [Rhodococcus spongiicola]|nr:hypothetical protein [Rhodococcus spongiicola]